MMTLARRRHPVYRATTALGTFETCRRTQMMSAIRGRPEAIDARMDSFRTSAFYGIRCFHFLRRREDPAILRP